MITSYLWERGWEEEMVQGSLQSPVGKWCLGMGRFPQTLITGEEAQVLFCYIYISRISGTLGWEPQIASSCSLAFYSREVIPPTLIHPPSFITEGLLSPTKLTRRGWVRTGWHHACVAGLLWLLPSRGALVSEWPEKRQGLWQGGLMIVSPEFILTVRSMCRRESFLDHIDTIGWGLLSLWHKLW